jgi:hypothetical protein
VQLDLPPPQGKAEAEEVRRRCSAGARKHSRARQAALPCPPADGVLPPPINQPEGSFASEAARDSPPATLKVRRAALAITAAFSLDTTQISHGCQKNALQKFRHDACARLLLLRAHASLRTLARRMDAATKARRARVRRRLNRNRKNAVPTRTLYAPHGTTPTIDGVISAGEYDDVCHTGLELQTSTP